MHFLSFLTDYLRNNKKAFQTFKWVANAFVFVGAAVISLSPASSQLPWPFMLSIIGSTMWLCAAIIMKERALVAFNIFFVFIQTIAILMRLHN